MTWIIGMLFIYKHVECKSTRLKSKLLFTSMFTVALWFVEN